jgi:hypothetical protein
LSVRRHLLIVASQCASMDELIELERAAADLRDVLVDPSLGCCEGGLDNGEPLISGDVSRAEIEAAIEQATQHAAKNGATLLLALLGHGFIPGQSGHLYYMAAGSIEGNRQSAVDVNKVLLEMVDTAGVNGVVALIDTCMAAGGIPSLQQVTAGNRGGRLNLELLLASAASEEASDMRFSRELARVIKSGMSIASDHLDVGHIRSELRNRVPGQSVACLQYSGEEVDNLWVTRNHLRSTVIRPFSVVGTTGLRLIRECLGDLGHHDLHLEEVQAGRLASIISLLGGAAPSIAKERASQIIGNVDIAIKTTRFLRDHLEPALSTVRLRRALATVHQLSRIPLPRHELEYDVDFIEHVVLGMSGPPKTSKLQVVRFVTALASDMGISADAHFRRWVHDIDATVVANDVAEEIASDTSGQRFRLVISLHESLLGFWPEVLHGWLLLDGSEIQHELFTAEPSQSGAEQALGAAVDWADQAARDMGLNLRRIDVAAPAMILATWRPEEVNYGPKLGLTYDVVWRWSERINPPAGMKWMEPRARRVLAAISSSHTVEPVDWISPSDVKAPELADKLRNGAFEKAIGITDYVDNTSELLHLLLHYSPIVIWPIRGTTAGVVHRDLIRDQWLLMPGALLTAYRDQWRQLKIGGIAELRGIWDDHEWLDFCRLTQA